MMYRFLFTLLLSLGVIVSLHAQDPPCATVTITNPDTVSICQGDVIQLRQTNTLGNENLRWSPSEGFIDDVTDPSPRVAPSFSRYYRVTVGTAGSCQVADSIYVQVDRLVVPELIGDTTVCQGTELQLVRTPVTDVGNTIYAFSPSGPFLEDSTDVNSIYIARSDTVFTLVSTSENGVCSNTQEVRINVTQSEFEIAEDTIFTCLGTGPVTLSVNAFPNVQGPITWSPARFNTSPPTGTTFTVEPTADITYFAQANVNGCPQIDSVSVRLDSLPADLGLTLDPEKDPYCQGDTFYVQSPIYDAGDFPLITHEWFDALGLQSPQDLYNAVFVGQDTTTLRRRTSNGSCVDTSEISVNVVEPPIVTFEPADPIVCPGVPVQITATFETGEGTLEWMDSGNTLSCTNCLDPIATVSSTTEYMIELVTEDGECTSDLTYTVTVAADIEPNIESPVVICPGDSRRLILGNIVDGYTYTITGGGMMFTDPLTVVTPTESTVYTIETTGPCGTNSQTVNVIVGGDYTLTADGPSTVCAGDPITLTAVTNPEGITGTYTWTLPDGSTLPGQQITVDNPVAGSYSVTLVDEQGCGSATAQTVVDVLGQTVEPIIVATLQDGMVLGAGQALSAGNTVTLSVTNLPTDLNFNYSWSGNYNPMTSGDAEITVTVPRANGQPEPLNYAVTVTSEQGGCDFTANLVLPVQQSQVQIPEVITPNGDGRNDRFRIFFNGVISDYSMVVYNRWGQKVWTSEDPNEGWDGTKDGTPQNQDIYLYLARFRQDGAELEREGQFTLIR